MKKPIIVTLPHQHTKAEAIKRIREGLEKMKPQLAPLHLFARKEWRGDDLHFNVVTMKQTVSGRIHVMDDSVRVEVDLPWILTAIAEMVRGQIVERGSKILLRNK